MADQICYAVLCVFSYVAAGQDQGQKKNPVVITPQIQDLYTQQKQQMAKEHQQQQENKAITNEREMQIISTDIPTKHGNNNSNQTVIIKHAIEIQKPTITTTTVQPQAKLMHTHVKNRPLTASTTTTTMVNMLNQECKQITTQHANMNKGLPQLPPRLPSQTSIESIHSIATSPSLSTSSAESKRRSPQSTPPLPPGPPPVIPPRTGFRGRSASIQTSTITTTTTTTTAAAITKTITTTTTTATTNSILASRNFKRQISINTVPQYTPQPPPPFIIPKRYSTLSRAASIAGSTITTLASTLALTSASVSASTSVSAAGSTSSSSSMAVGSNSMSTNLMNIFPSNATQFNLQSKRLSYGTLNFGNAQFHTSLGGGNANVSPQSNRKH